MIRTGNWNSNPNIYCRSSPEYLRTLGCSDPLSRGVLLVDKFEGVAFVSIVV